MKKAIVITGLLAGFFLLLTNCKKEKEEEAVTPTPVGVSVPQNYSLKVYTNDSEDYDKSMEGETSENYFTSYSDFEAVIGQSYFIPKNIRAIIMENKATKKKVHITYDENYLPTSFYEYDGSTTKNVFYQVFYETERTVIYQNTLVEGDRYRVTDSVELAPLSTPLPKVSALKTSGTTEVDCDKLFKETADYLHPCSKETLYQDVADTWESSSSMFGLTSLVGQAVSWTITTVQSNFCKSEQQTTKVSGEFTCDEYQTNTDNQDLCGVVMTCNTDCNGELNGSAYLDDCSICVGGSTGKKPCITDCNGDLGGSAYYDACGKCVGGNTNKVECSDDCNGDLGGIAFIDACGVCAEGNTGIVPNSSCEDCNGDINGSAYIDNCDQCVGGNTGQTECSVDCNGDAGGSAELDNCGVCAGGNTGITPNESCVDCNGDANGTAYLDNCDQCVGGNTGLTECSLDCNGDPDGSAYEDDCGVCVGGNTGKTANETCVDCNGTPNGTASIDDCGECTGGTTGKTPCNNDTTLKVGQPRY